MKILTICFLIATTQLCLAQRQEETAIRQIYDKALTEGQSYAMLDYLSNKIGSRLSGSPGAAAAVEWSKRVMQDAGFDSVMIDGSELPFEDNIKITKEVVKRAAVEHGVLLLDGVLAMHRTLRLRRKVQDTRPCC